MLLRGRPIVPGRARGYALVSSKPLSFLGGVDPKTGVIIERGHDLYGIEIKDKILCLPQSCGSTVGSYVLYAMAKNGVAPKAIVISSSDPVVVVGAVIANIPMVENINIYKIKTGDIVEVDGESGLVKVYRE
ncbi:MAG: DUF126 domain-containing protein [Candidatus Bathyarchaeia archaeon]